MTRTEGVQRTEPGGESTRDSFALGTLRRVVMGVCVLAVSCLLLVPDSFLRFLRVEYHVIGTPMNWIEAHSATVNLAHVVAFAAFGFAVRMGVSARTRYVLAFSIGVSSVSELAQFWVPGRTPRVSDAFLDVGGAIVGIACAGFLLWITGRQRLQERRGMH